jgi:hypothetical protein
VPTAKATEIAIVDGLVMASFSAQLSLRRRASALLVLDR